MTTASGHTSAIRAKKVIGTSVKDTAGNKIGVIEDVVLDKESNNIMFAVVGFGGFGSVRRVFWYSGYVVSAPPFAASTGTP